MTLVLAAPLAGWATRLDEVPDPAFAQGLVGDGVAIDPISSELCAPCDGVIASLHRAHHACTLRAACGAEILLHVGVDTVELRGEGFRPLVAAGQRVRTGEPLIGIDLDLVVRRARSLHTPVLLVGGDGFAVIERVVDREVAVGDALLSIARLDARDAAHPPAGEPPGAEQRVRLLVPHGLHARPAAAFARRARHHAGTVTVGCGRRSANGKSMTSLMALDARPGDELAIAASGPGAPLIVSELAALVASGLGDTAALDGARLDRGGAVAANGAQSRVGAALAADGAQVTGGVERAVFSGGAEIVLEGVAAVRGLAVGRVVRLAEAVEEPVVPRDGAGGAIELARLAAALGDVRHAIEQTVAGAEARGDAVMRDIFRAHLDLIEDPELTGAADREIAAGRSAGWAWRAAIRELAAALRGLGNPLLAARAADLADLERRTLAVLAGSEATGRVAGRIDDAKDARAVELPEGAVVIADELLPSELAALPVGRVAGLGMARGGATSHVAILAAGLGVPAVVGLGEAVLRVPEGAPVIVDGDRGLVCAFPAAATRAATERAIAGRAERRRAALANAHQAARTSDGVEIAVHANLGAVGDAAIARDCGAEGCGLLRTEFLFLDRRSAPSEDEQAARYQEIADALQGRPLVIRTLDAGADKPLAYLPQAGEDNPALGVRGVRLALRHPAILRAQLRAILRVRPAGACRILVPMIASLGELRAVRAMLDEERRALDAAPVELGAMIELPVAALAAAALAREADFFSIGTNDLAQYALAIDRGNADLAAGLAGLHPGVLRLVASTVRGAQASGRPVSVCGGAAADPCAVPLLVGVGLRALSVAPAAVPEIKAVLRTLSVARCAEVAAAALELDSSEAVRALVVNTWPGLAAHA